MSRHLDDISLGTPTDRDRDFRFGVTDIGRDGLDRSGAVLEVGTLTGFITGRHALQEGCTGWPFAARLEAGSAARGFAACATTPPNQAAAVVKARDIVRLSLRW